MDELNDFNIKLEEKKSAKWQATIIVKIELTKNLEKSCNSYMGSKKFPKLSLKNIFRQWSRNLKTVLNTIPLCLGSFVKGPLQNSRSEPNAE